MSTHPLHAQISHGGRPLGPALMAKSAPPPTYTVHLPTASAKVLEASHFGPYPYGARIPVDLSIKEDGQATSMSDGGRVWRIRVESPGAEALRLSYSEYRVPPGGRLFVYTEDARVVRGAFTAQNNKANGRFATDLTPGASVIVEYYEPTDADFSGTVRIGAVVHAWEAAGHPASTKQADTYTPRALSCSINTACPAADAWATEARATVLIDRGGSTCSGVLLNNVRGDHRPFVLTANHCSSPSAGQAVNWTFKFNYASATCTDPADAPGAVSITGATVRAANGGYTTDFTLLELSSFIPPSYNVHYAGWSLASGAPSSGTTMGHPRGDIRKIAFDDDVLYDNSTRWIADLDRGTAEGGSSGSPLFDENHRVVGHLSSALDFEPNTCSGPGGDDNEALIGFPKLSYIWDQGTPGQRVSDWLDPDGTGALSIDGQDGPPSSSDVLWVNEVDGNSAVGSSSDDAEFVEIAGPPGADVSYADVEIYRCTSGSAVLERTETLVAGAALSSSGNTGYFVLGGPGVGTAHQRFNGSGVGVIPDGHGLVVLRDRYGDEVFSYQYDLTQNGAPTECPAARTTRSVGDDYDYPSGHAAGKQSQGSASMGFGPDSAPGSSTPGTVGYVPSPGAPNDTVMPVELTTFTALQDEDAVRLRWRTAGETNNAGFEVQHRSADAQAWTALAFVEGAGTTSAPQTYAYRTAQQAAGTHAFRLKQVDIEGSFEYSPVARITVAPTAPFQLTAPHPNPVSGRARFTLSVAKTQQIDLAVYDLLGRRVAVLHQGTLPGGEPKRLRIEAHAWPSGVYLLRARGQQFSAVRRLVVIR